MKSTGCLPSDWGSTKPTSIHKVDKAFYTQCIKKLRWSIKLWCLSIRCCSQRDHPRSGLPRICSSQSPRPASDFWLGVWPIGELPSLSRAETWSPSLVEEDQRCQAAVRSLHGVWRESGTKRNRSKPCTLLQPSVQPQTQLLPLLMPQIPSP